MYTFSYHLLNTLKPPHMNTGQRLHSHNSGITRMQLLHNSGLTVGRNDNSQPRCSAVLLSCGRRVGTLRHHHRPTMLTISNYLGQERVHLCSTLQTHAMGSSPGPGPMLIAATSSEGSSWEFQKSICMH